MTAIRVFNDTTKTWIVRIVTKDNIPTSTAVQPQKSILANTQSEELLVKLWNNNVLLVQDRG